MNFGSFTKYSAEQDQDVLREIPEAIPPTDSQRFCLKTRSWADGCVLICLSLCRESFTANASQKSVRNTRNRRSGRRLKTDKDALDEPTNVSEPEPERIEDSVQVDARIEKRKDTVLDNMPSRENVLWACTVTSSLIAALGLIIREVISLRKP